IAPKITPSTPRSAISHQLRARAAPRLSNGVTTNRPGGSYAVLVLMIGSKRIAATILNTQNIGQSAPTALIPVNSRSGLLLHSRGRLEVDGIALRCACVCTPESSLTGAHGQH